MCILKNKVCCYVESGLSGGRVEVEDQLVQMKDDGSTAQSNNGGDGQQWMDSASVMEVESIAVTDKKGKEGNPKFLA